MVNKLRPDTVPESGPFSSRTGLGLNTRDWVGAMGVQDVEGPRSDLQNCQKGKQRPPSVG